MPSVGFEATNLSRRTAADLRLRKRGHWDRLKNLLVKKIPYFILLKMPLPYFQNPFSCPYAEPSESNSRYSITLN